MSYFAGERLTAAALNAFLSRNASQDFISANQTTSSASYVDLATVGPTVTVSSAGDSALVLWSAGMFSGDGTLRGGYCDFIISGATARAAGDATALKVTATNAGAGFDAMKFAWVTITPGSNIYTLKYKSASGSFAFQNRSLMVFAP